MKLKNFSHHPISRISCHHGDRFAALLDAALACTERRIYWNIDVLPFAPPPPDWLQNLTIAFGDSMPDQERERILRSIFGIWAKQSSKCCTFENEQGRCACKSHDCRTGELLECYEQRARHDLSGGAHRQLGNVLVRAISREIAPANIVVRPLDNRYLNNFIVKVRTMYGHTILARRNGMRDMITALKCKEAVGILMDQNAKRSQGIFVDFFDKPANTVPVIAILALRYDVTCHPRIHCAYSALIPTPCISEQKSELNESGDAKKDIEINGTP